MADEIKYSKKQLDKLLRDVYDGNIDPVNLPRDLYLIIMALLSSGVARGYGKRKKKLSKKTKNLFAHFDHNVGVFSAAKTHQQVVDMRRALIDPLTGSIRSFSEFKPIASAVFDQYNKNWLKTEFRTAVNQGFAARQWEDFQENKDELPLLRYDTAGDERVREEHVTLDGIVRPVDDPFWNTHFPPNGWNCRCDVTQHERGDFKVTPKSELKGVKPPDELFRFNPAKDKVIFDPDHPYISNVAQRYKAAQKDNFNLPVPPKPDA